MSILSEVGVGLGLLLVLVGYGGYVSLGMLFWKVSESRKNVVRDVLFCSFFAGPLLVLVSVVVSLL